MAFVVGKGPGTGLPSFGAVIERCLGINALAEIDSMGVVFGRGQDQLGEGEIAGVEIQWAGLFALELAGELLLPVVGGDFDLRQVAGVDVGFEGEKLLFEAVAHAGLVIVGFGEVEGFALEQQRAEFLHGALLGPGKGLIVARADGDQQQDGGWGVDLAHNKNSKTSFPIAGGPRPPEC